VLGEWFPVVPVNEDDFVHVLLLNGFCAESLETWVIPAPDWVEAGFDHIVLIAGTKKAPSGS